MSRPEDEGLAAANYAELNGEFYRAEPAQYFQHRWSNLLLVASRDEELRQMLDDDDGVSLGTFTMTRKQDAEPRDPNEDERSQHNFVALETEVLLHHVAETLLRLFVAHRGIPPCPWLELAGLRSFSAFKKELAEVFIDGEAEARVDDVAEVFFGGVDRESIEPKPSDEDWERSLSNVDRFLVYYAHRLLSDAHLYNAVKHGLAVQPGERGMKLDVPDLPITAEGMALQFLEVKDGEWHQTVTWVKSDLAAVYIMTAITLMEQLWQIGRARYTGKGDVEIQVFDGDPHQVIAEAKKADGPVTVSALSRKLLYHVSIPDTDE